MIGLLHPQVTSREVTAGKCPSGTIWSPPSYSHGFVETSFRRPICRCGVPRGCPLREAGTHADVSRRPRGPFPSRVWAVFPGRTADPHASSEPWNPRPPCVCVCPGLLAETLTFWVSAGPPAPPVGATWLPGKEPRCPGRQLALPPECPHCCGSCSLTVVALAAGVLGCPELLGVGNARLLSPRCPLLSEAQQIRHPHFPREPSKCCANIILILSFSASTLSGTSISCQERK